MRLRWLSGMLLAALAGGVAAASPAQEWDDTLPKWSPDGRQIAFTSTRDGNADIFVVGADGTGLRQLTRESLASKLSVYHSPVDNWPTWSPAGDRIAFSSGRDNTRLSYVLKNIYVMAADGAKVTRASGREGGDQPSWSPDGQRVAFTNDPGGNWDIHVMNVNGSGLTRLTDHPAVDDQPAWSPDGKRIAFTSKRGGTANIYVMNADGTGMAVLTAPDGRTSNALPAWSPDGRRIVFTSNRDSRDYELYVMASDGTGVARLTTSAGSTMPSWSPDGRRIVYACRRGGHYRLCVMNADGSGAAPLTPGG